MIFDPVISPVNSGVILRKFCWRINSTPVYDAFLTLRVLADTTAVYSIVAGYGALSASISGGAFDSTGLFTYSGNGILLELERPSRLICVPGNTSEGLLCTLDKSVLKFETSYPSVGTNLTLRLNSPLYYQLTSDTLTIGISHVNPDNKVVSQSGLLRINGVVPDAYGNLNIRSLIPSLNVRVYSVEDDSSSGE